MTRYEDLGASVEHVAVDGDAGITIHDNGKHLHDVWIRYEIATRRILEGSAPRGSLPLMSEELMAYVRNILLSCEECSQRSDGWETVALLTFDELLYLDMKVTYPILHGVKFDLGPEETDPIRE